MNYFWIIGLLLIPFLLNPIRNLDSKPKFWTHPLFFVISIIAILQIGLSWFTLMAISSFIAYSVIASIIFVIILIFVIAYSLKIFIHNKHHLKSFWSFFVKNNSISFLSLALLLIGLIFLLVFSQIGTFSDTNAYVNAGIYFKNDLYTFDNNQPLDFFYRYTTGYYFNSVFNSNLDIEFTYRIVWPLLTYYLFYWAISFYLEEKCNNWKTKYKLIFLIFLNSIFISLSFVLMYSLTSGNYEIQALFIFIAFLLAITKKFNYFLISFLAFPFFSITATLISVPILLGLIIYNFFKSSKLNFLYSLIILTYFGFNLLAFKFDQSSNYLLQLFSILSISFILFGTLSLFFLSKNYRFITLYQNVLFIRQINIYLNKFSWKKEWVYFALYLLTYVIVFLLTQFVVTAIESTKGNLWIMYIGGTCLFIIYIAYRLYQLIKKQKTFDPTKWLLFFQIFYIIYVVGLEITSNIFVTNPSAWRIFLSSFTVGFLSTYVGMIGIQIAIIINNHFLYFTEKMWISKTKRLQKLYILSIRLCIAFILISSAITIGVWVSNYNKINALTNDFKWNKPLNTIDQEILKSINRNPIQSNSIDQNQLPPYSYYSDLRLNFYLDKLYGFSSLPTWESNLFNDFISSDIWITTIQDKSQSNVLYYDLENTIKNFDFIVMSAIENINNNQLIPYPYIDKNIITNQISVLGAPDYIILNKNTNYYESLDLIQKFNQSSKKDDFVYNLTTSNNANQLYGYEFLAETSDIIYFLNNKTITKIMSS